MFIKFFRTNGLNLISDLFLIIAGILLALAIDDWAKEREFMANNNRFLQSIYQDVEEDLEQLQSKQESYQAQIDLLTIAQQQLNSDSDETEQSTIQIQLNINNNFAWDVIRRNGDLSLLPNELFTTVLSIEALAKEAKQIERQLWLSASQAVYQDNQQEARRLSTISYMYRISMAVTAEQIKALQEFKLEYEKYTTVNL